MMALVPLFSTLPSKVPLSLMVPLFVTSHVKMPPEIFPVLLFVTLHPFWKVPSLMLLLFVTSHPFWKVPLVMVPLFVTMYLFWKVPSLMVPSFVTPPLKVLFSMVLLFFTSPLKMPLEIVPPELLNVPLCTVPLKVPPVIVTYDSISILHLTAETGRAPVALGVWGWVELKSNVPPVRISVSFMYPQPLPTVPFEQVGRPFEPMMRSPVEPAAKAPRGSTESTMLSARIRLRMRFFIGVVLLFCQRLQQRPHGRSFLGPAYHKSSRKGSKTA